MHVPFPQCEHILANGFFFLLSFARICNEDNRTTMKLNFITVGDFHCEFISLAFAFRTQTARIEKQRTREWVKKQPFHIAIATKESHFRWKSTTKSIEVLGYTHKWFAKHKEWHTICTFDEEKREREWRRKNPLNE